jgi:hypothetical protein
MKNNSDYNSLLSRLPTLEPRAGLEHEIMAKIYIIQERRVRIRASLYGLTTIVSLASLYPAFELLATKANESGFSEYVSLVGSDGTGLLGSWKDFLFSVVESAPMLEISLVLGIVLAFAYSLRKGARYAEGLLSAHRGTFASA